MSTSAAILLCPGQGAQAVGMGRAWFEKSPAARAVLERADAVLADALGAPLTRLCFEGPDETLSRTDVAQPAIFAVSVACAHGLYGASAPADLLAAAGLSLGEYTALHLAGSISFEDGLRLVALRGKAMQDAAEASKGGMVALIGADEEQAHTVCERAAKGEVLVSANFNAPGQIVLSGHATACDRAVQEASGMGLRATKLSVAGAFHSPLMAPAAERLSKALEQTEVCAPRARVMSNVTGLPHGEGPDAGRAIIDSIRARLVEQLTRPVRWDLDCAWLGANAKGAFHEMAPGRVLAGLMRRIDKSVKVATHDEPGE